MYSCQNNEQPKKAVVKASNYKAPLDNRELINRLQDSIVHYGNERAYNELASYYVLENWNEELFYYSLSWLIDMIMQKGIIMYILA